MLIEAPTSYKPKHFKNVKLTHISHPLIIHSGLIPSYPGDGVGGAIGETGKDAEI